MHALEPVPLAASIELRAAAGEYAAALELCCSYLPPYEREALEGSLRVRYGFHLVAAGDVAGGLGQFARTPRGPVCALQLVPGLVPGLAAAVEALPQVQELAALQRPEPGTQPERAGARGWTTGSAAKPERVQGFGGEEGAGGGRRWGRHN